MEGGQLTKEEFVENVKAFTGELFDLNDFIKHTEFNKDTEELDLYLIDKLFPALFPGIEELSREVEKLMDENGAANEEVRARFNPCLFLAQYLMRNNPTYNQDEFKDNMFYKYSDSIRKSRRLAGKKHGYIKYFKLKNANRAECKFKDMDAMIKEFDEQYNMKGNFTKDLLHTPFFNELREDPKREITTDKVYEEFSEFLINNDKVSFSAVVAAEERFKIN